MKNIAYRAFFLCCLLMNRGVPTELTVVGYTLRTRVETREADERGSLQKRFFYKETSRCTARMFLRDHADNIHAVVVTD